MKHYLFLKYLGGQGGKPNFFSFGEQFLLQTYLLIQIFLCSLHVKWNIEDININIYFCMTVQVIHGEKFFGSI